MAGRDAYDVLRDLALAYPRQRIDQRTVEANVRQLADLPPDVLDRAARALSRTGEFHPSVAELREAAAEETLSIPTEAEALAQIDARQAWAREGDTTDPPFVHPLVRAALDQVGGWHSMRTADRPEVIRGQLARIYRDRRAAAIHHARTGDAAC